MKAYCLASSSSGNCFILDFEIKGCHNLIMIECGIPLSQIYKKCNEFKINLADVKACLITHAHNDHCKSAKDLQRLNIPIFAHKRTLQAISCKGNDFILNEPKQVLNGLFVMAFEVEHDIEGAIGFVIKTAEETVIFVNDSKYWKTNLINFKPDYVFIECNYDNAMVYAQYHELKKKLATPELYDDDELKEMRTKIKQHERNINAHMSLKGSIRNLKTLNLRHCKTIFLMHLSDRYANEYKMKNEIMSTFGIRTYACGKNGGIK